jgi:hypothetical protein
MSATLLSDLDNKSGPAAGPPPQPMQPVQPMQQPYSNNFGQSPQYILYVMPNSPGSARAIKHYQILHKKIRLINLTDLPRAKIPKWLTGAPTLVDLQTRKMFTGSLAIDHLYHLALAQTQSSALLGNMNPAGPAGPGPAPDKSFAHYANRPVAGSVSRSDRMEKPIGPPPPSLAPSQTELGLQHAMKERMEKDMDPMPPPSVDPNGSGNNRRGGGAGDPQVAATENTKDPDLNPKKTSNLGAAFAMPDMSEVDKAKYNLGGSKKLKHDEVEQYKAMREKVGPPK